MYNTLNNKTTFCWAKNVYDSTPLQITGLANRVFKNHPGSLVATEKF